MTELALVTSQMPGALSPVSYAPPEDLAFESWEAVGKGLAKLMGASKWWLGDWLAFGEVHYGEMYSQALDSTEFKYQTLVNAASVSRRVEIYRRRENLSWSHHEAVAKCTPEEQADWLDKAEERHWTVTDLRTAMRPPDRPPTIEPPPQTVAEAPPDGRAVEPGPDPRSTGSAPPDLIQPSVDVSAELEAWSRRRIGMIWQEEHHLELMSRLGKVLAGG